VFEHIHRRTVCLCFFFNSEGFFKKFVSLFKKNDIQLLFSTLHIHVYINSRRNQRGKLIFCIQYSDNFRAFLFFLNWKLQLSMATYRNPQTIWINLKWLGKTRLKFIGKEWTFWKTIEFFLYTRKKIWFATKIEKKNEWNANSYIKPSAKIKVVLREKKRPFFFMRHRNCDIRYLRTISNIPRLIKEKKKSCS